MPVPNLPPIRLLLFQSYKESTWGSTGVATAKWMGIQEYPEFKPYRKSTLFNEARGNLAPAFIDSILRKGGEWKVNQIATFEDILFPMFMCAGSASGSSPYTFTSASTVAPNVTPCTIEYNYPPQSVQGQGCIANKIVIKAEAEKEWQIETSGFAYDIDPSWSGSPANLGDRTVEAILMAETGICLDVAASGSPGVTSFANIMNSFTWTYENSIKPIYTGGSLAPQGTVVSGAMKSTLELELLWTPTLRTWVNTNWNTGLQGLVQVKAVSGSKYATLNFNGALSDEIAYFGNKDGAEIVKVKLDAAYNPNPGAQLWTNFLVQNGVLTLP
jgi:hypothetical protein